MKKVLSLIWGISITVLSIISCTFAYTQEQREAYEWAYKYKITTQPTIEAANLNWNITRQAFAKMIVNYLENAVWVRQNTSNSCYFPDENKITNNLKPYTKKTCSYNIMWSNWSNFNPKDTLTKAHLWTVLSRILWWDKHNSSWNWYYIYHVNALQNAGIMDNINNVSKTPAKRWDVLVMLKRMYDKFGSGIYMNNWNNSVNYDTTMDSKQNKNSVETQQNKTESTKENNTTKSYNKTQKIVEDMIENYPVRWNKNARFTIIEYVDLLCPYCAKVSQDWTINTLIKEFSGEVNSISRHFIIHWNDALILANAIECIGELKPSVYYTALEKAFEAYPVDIEWVTSIAIELWVNKSSLQSCIRKWKYKKAVKNMMDQWEKEFKVSWTPIDVIVDRKDWDYRVLPGSAPVDTLIEFINVAIEEKKDK